MSAIPNPAQSEFSKGSLPVKSLVEVLATDTADLENAPDAIALAAPAAPSPDQQVNAMSLDAVRQSVDSIATGQEQMTREITKLHEIEQYILYKNSRPAPAPTCNPVPRSAPAPTVR